MGIKKMFYKFTNLGAQSRYKRTYLFFIQLINQLSSSIYLTPVEARFLMIDYQRGETLPTLNVGCL